MNIEDRRKLQKGAANKVRGSMRFNPATKLDTKQVFIEKLPYSTRPVLRPEAKKKLGARKFNNINSSIIAKRRDKWLKEHGKLPIHSENS